LQGEEIMMIPLGIPVKTPEHIQRKMDELDKEIEEELKNSSGSPSKREHSDSKSK